MKYLIGAIIASILLIGTFIGGYYYGSQSKKPIEVKKVIVEDTVWKDKYLTLKTKLSAKPKFTEEDKEKISVEDFNNLVWCYNSALEYSHYTKDNTLYVSVTDGCKSADAQFKIGTKNNWTMYFTVGAIGVAVGATAIALLK